jgi:hypothetical protein
MKNHLILSVLLASGLFFNQCGNTDKIVSTEKTGGSLAFNGVDRGEYILYGHSDLNAKGEINTVQKMNETLQTTGAFEGKVAVTINEVCKKAGCWITFDNDGKDPVRVFFRDHFTIPTTTPSGTSAILLGIANQDTLTVEFQKHLLDDAVEAGKKVEQAAYDAIAEDIIELTFDCEAILVKKP